MNNQHILGKLLKEEGRKKVFRERSLFLSSGIQISMRRVENIENGEVIEPVIVKMMEILCVSEEERKDCEKRQEEFIQLELITSHKTAKFSLNKNHHCIVEH